MELHCHDGMWCRFAVVSLFCRIPFSPLDNVYCCIHIQLFVENHHEHGPWNYLVDIARNHIAPSLKFTLIHHLWWLRRGNMREDRFNFPGFFLCDGRWEGERCDICEAIIHKRQVAPIILQCAEIGSCRQMLNWDICGSIKLRSDVSKWCHGVCVDISSNPIKCHLLHQYSVFSWCVVVVLVYSIVLLLLSNTVHMNRSNSHAHHLELARAQMEMQASSNKYCKSSG